MTETTLAAIAAVSVLAGGGTGWWMRKTSRALKPRVVHLELARKPEDIDAILASWGHSGTKTAQRVILADFAFLAAYGGGLISLVQLMGSWTPGWKISQLATSVAFVAGGAAVLDALENTGALLMIHGRRKRWPSITNIAARVKFLGVAVVAVWCATWVMWGEVILLARLGRGTWEAAPTAWQWLALFMPN